MYTIYIIKKMPCDKEYAKKYYEDHKEKIKMQIKISHTKQSIKNLVEKLNDENKSFARFPHGRIERYNIKFDKETKKYYL